MQLRAVLATHLQDPEAGWSMGTFGALAEFHQDVDETIVRDEPERLIRATARGAIRLQLTEETCAVAFEALSARADAWSHGLALCLPERRAAKAERSTLTELGPDTQAIRGEDRDAILFDIGLGAAGPGCRQLEFCVRTADSALIERLRAATGRSVLDPASSAMTAILEAHPHRVASTRLGRVEVYQPIGGAATGGKSPAGPHTHVLPKLLAKGRTHSADVPIPEDVVPCAWLYPANPVSTPLGREKPFDRPRHEAFQRLLQVWGAPAHVETKRCVREAVAADREPSTFEATGGRFERAAIRIALRQLHVCADSDQRRTLVRRWRDAFDTDVVEQDPLEAEHE